MIRIKKSVAAATGVAVLAALVAAPVLAEEAGSALTEIIVTAQKRAQNVQDVGIAVSAISGDELSALGAATATDITKSMPSIVLTQPNGPSSFSLSIRGVTQNDFADHQESPAAIYVDDVYVSQMAGLAFSMFDMERVEVLRGPQGTLFGRNATGGLANFVTRRPSDAGGGYLDVTFGQRNLTRIEGAVNGALADGVDGRVSFLSNHYDPLVKNIAGGAPDAENGNDWAVRGQLLFKDVAGGQLLLNARTSREDVHAGSWEQYPTELGPGGANFFVGPNENYWGTCNGCNASGVPRAQPFTTTNNQAGYARIKNGGATLKYTLDLGGTTFTAIGDYSALNKQYQEDSDVSPYTVFQFFNGSDVKQKSLELRLNGGDQTLNWTAGVYGLKIDGNYYEGWQGPAFFGAEQFNVNTNLNSAYSGWDFSPGPWPWSTSVATAGPSYLTGALPDPSTGGLPATKAPYELTTKSYAAFGQVEYRLSDLVGLTLGARYTGDKKDYDYSWGPFEYVPGSLTNATFPLTRPQSVVLAQDYVNSRSDNLWAGKAQVDFHLAPHELVYVSYNRGVKGGGFTAPLFPATVQSLGDMTFRPEVLTSYELGMKSEFLDRTLRLNSAVYYYDYKDYQALVYTVSLNQLVKNADATHKGAETELEWAPSEAWRLGLGVAYVDAIVKNVDARGSGVPGNWVPPNAPRWSGNAMIRYTLPVGSGKLALQADGNYLTRFWFNLGDYPAVEQAAYGVGNARVSYVPSSGKVEVGVAVENIADKHYGLMGFDNSGVNGLAQRYPGMPRWFKAHVNYHF